MMKTLTRALIISVSLLILCAASALAQSQPLTALIKAEQKAAVITIIYKEVGNDAFFDEGGLQSVVKTKAGGPLGKAFGAPSASDVVAIMYEKGFELASHTTTTGAPGYDAKVLVCQYVFVRLP